MGTTIDEIFSTFSDQIAQKLLYQRSMKSLAEKELEELVKYYEFQKDNPTALAMKEGHNMIFQDAATGESKYYAQIQRNVDQMIRAVHLHKNKQYQWLLAEAYEAFEDFLEAAYAFLGMADPSLWPMQDFGNISIGEIPENDFNWFQERVRDKKGVPATILNQLRKKFPQIVEIERKNSFNVNLRLSIEMIETLRHIIVHKSGVVEDKDKFLERVLSKSALWQNGKADAHHLRFLNSFFLGNELSNHISLLEIRADPKIPISVYYIDRFDLLIDHMMAYSSFIIDCFREHIAKKNGA